MQRFVNCVANLWPFKFSWKRINRWYFWFIFQAREKYEVSDAIKRLDPSDIANAVVYAVTQPAHCAINEIMIEPTDAPC